MSDVDLERATHTHAHQQHKPTPVTITLEDVGYSLKAKKKTLNILQGVRAHFQPAKMTALMGPSGSGKTTLLDVIAGRKNVGTVEGSVLYNGAQCKPSALKDAVGYVQQFDTLVGELTVREMLMYTAELRLPAATTRAARTARVDEVIDKLALGSCAATVIGNPLKRGISGGQAKRVNIALALISRPSVIFLDEPTSGLDSAMANEVASCLKALAAEGRTIVCTIHSPTAKAFAMFDSLMMLSSGRLIYGGPLESAAPHFEKALALKRPVDSSAFSLPEWLVDVTTAGKPAEELALAYDSSAVAKTHDAERLAIAPPSSLLTNEGEGAKPGAGRQLLTLLRYRMLTHYKSPEFLGPRIGDKVMFGLLILSLYWKIGEKNDAQSIASTSALLYFISALCGYGAAAFVPSLTLDRPLFYRELADGFYRPLVYYASKFVEEAVLATLTSLLFSVTIFWGCGLQGSFWVFAVCYYLTTMTGIVLAYLIAALVPTMDAANALLPTYVTCCMYFGGLFLLFDRIPGPWVWFSWTSFLRYSWGAQMLNNYQGQTIGETLAFFDDAGQGITVLEFYGLRGSIMGSIGACVGMLAVCTFVFALLGALTISYVRWSR